MVTFNVLDAADTLRKLIAIGLTDDNILLFKGKIVVGIGVMSELSKGKYSDLQ